MDLGPLHHNHYVQAIMTPDLDYGLSLSTGLPVSTIMPATKTIVKTCQIMSSFVLNAPNTYENLQGPP